MTEIQNSKPKTSQRTGMTDRVRAAGTALNDRPPARKGTILRLGEEGFSRRELFQAVNTRNRAEDMAFKESWLELIRRRELVKLGLEKYRYDPDKAARAHVKIRVFRAMHVKGAFCASDIAKLSEADISYVQTLIRKMVWDEWLEFTGTKERVKFFRVRNSEKFYLEFVRNVGQAF